MLWIVKIIFYLAFKAVVQGPQEDYYNDIALYEDCCESIWLKSAHVQAINQTKLSRTRVLD